MLRFEECGKEATTEEGRRQRAYLTVVAEGEAVDIVVYGPDCAEGEFGDS